MKPNRFALSLLTLFFVTSAALADNPFQWKLRSRSKSKTGSYQIKFQQQTWNPKETAVVVCDMWDSHHSLNAVRRVKEISPRMNRFLVEARKRGAFIVHAPSSCMKPYKNHPARKRAQRAARAKNLPNLIAKWCYKIPSEAKGIYPLDQSDGGDDSEAKEQAAWQKKLAKIGRNPRGPWLAQIDVLKIENGDAISDSGVEIWNLMEQRKIKNVILVGVHTNMCVLGRPFGLRRMADNGKNVVLVRDMTDTMYNPARWPYVSHFQGTDLIVEHIEKFVCPTVTSDQLLGGKPFKFKNDKRKHAVIVIAEKLYKTKDTLPPFAQHVLKGKLGLRVTIVKADEKDRNRIPGLSKALKTADVVLLSVRRRALPTADMKAFYAYLKLGKPLVAIRTSSHAFDVRGNKPKGYAEWRQFDAEVLGGNYKGHHPGGPKTTASRAKGSKHAILKGIKTPFQSSGSLYKPSPLKTSTQLLLSGKIEKAPAEPIAWVNTFGNSRVFYTSLGHPDDFKNPQFVRLLHNAVRWAIKMKIDAKAAQVVAAE